MRWRRAGAGRRKSRGWRGRRARGRGRRVRAGARSPPGASSRSAMPWMRSGSASAPPTVARGLKAASGSWNTIWMRRRTARSASPRSASRSTPPKSMRPASGSTRRSRTRASVDLPLPDGPTRPSVSPARDGDRHVVERDDAAAAARDRSSRCRWRQGAARSFRRLRDQRRRGKVDMAGDQGRGVGVLRMRQHIGSRARPRPAAPC